MIRIPVLADAVLIQVTLAGDTAAFGTLVTRYERSLIAIARAVLHDRQLAEDAAQEAFLAAYTALPTLQNPQTFGPWLCTIARRRAIEMAQRKPQLVTLGDSPVNTLSPIAPALPFDEERLLSALLSLPEKERHVLMLRHFNAHDATAIAQITGESVGTITKRISRAHTRLRESLQEYLP